MRIFTFLSGSFSFRTVAIRRSLVNLAGITSRTSRFGGMAGPIIRSYFFKNPKIRSAVASKSESDIDIYIYIYIYIYIIYIYNAFLSRDDDNPRRVN